MQNCEFSCANNVIIVIIIITIIVIVGVILLQLLKVIRIIMSTIISCTYTCIFKWFFIQ